MWAQEDFYLILPSNTLNDRFVDNRPHHYNIELPQEILLRGDWEVGLTEIVYFKTWYQPRKVSLDDTHGVSWQYNTGEGKPLVTKTLPPAPYPGYYSVFEHVTDALVHDLAEIQIESNYQPGTRKVRWNIPADRTLRFPLPMARLLGFVALRHPDSSDGLQAQDYTVVPPFANQTDRFKIPEGEHWFELTNDDNDATMGVNLRPFIEATESDVDFCVNNTWTQNWLSHFIDVGPVVRRPISANPRLNFNQGFFSSCQKAFSPITLSILFRAYNHQIVFKENYTECAS